MVRPATLADIEDLIRIETLCFESDRLSRRSFRHLLTRGRAVIVVDELDGLVRGYALVRFRDGTPLARLYSYAVDPNHQRQGVGKRLIEAAEQVARDRDCITLRLEVRTDNLASQRLFLAAGYHQFGAIDDYYADHVGALRFERSLVAAFEPPVAAAPGRRGDSTIPAGRRP